MRARSKPAPTRCVLHPCYVAVLLALMGVDARAANVVSGPAQVEFNSAFLVNNGTPVDLSRYNKGNPAVPGTYSADLYVNKVWLGRASVTLRQIGQDNTHVVPCFDHELLERVGVDLTKINASAGVNMLGQNDKAASSQACVPLEQLIPDATASFDMGEQRLNVSVPQAAMNHEARGYVDHRFWNDGVTAGVLSYNANYFRSEQGGTSVQQSYLGLTAGFNVGPWRLRHTGDLTSSPTEGTHYQSMETNLQRSVQSLGDRLTIGDGYTDGSIFDSFGFRGVELATDDRMLPQSQRGYAPRITGVANSNAVVRVRQNGNIIYETNVAPGAFVIDDLYPTGFGGNLDVQVTEADGSVHEFTVPYAAAVNALRPGVTRYSVMAGLYRNPGVSGHPYVFQATVQHGFTNLLTGYAGMLGADDYLAGLVGVALNTSWGAVGLDVTQSTANLGSMGRRSGQSVRLSYSELISPTDTNVTVAAYRYSSSGYLDLSDAMAIRYGDLNAVDPLGASTPGEILRGRLQLTINQQLPSDWGSFYLSGSSQNYWNRGGNDTQFQMGYTTHVRSVSVNVSLTRQYDVSPGRWDNIAMINLGIPIGSGAQQVYATTSLQRDFSGQTSVQQSVTGSAGEDGALTWGLNGSRASGGDESASTMASGNVAYAAPFTTMSANVSDGTGFSQCGATLSGGVIAYGGGVVFAPALGDTNVVIDAKNASGARVVNGSGLRVDPWGHAIVSNLTPFSSNEIELDPKGLPLSVELRSTVEHVAPTAGAVVPLKFEAVGGGTSVLVQARLPGGDPIPFGAQVTDMAGHEVGTVAQSGRLLLRSMTAQAGEFQVRWGTSAAQQCVLPVRLPAPSSGSSAREWTTVEARCDTVVAQAAP